MTWSILLITSLAVVAYGYRTPSAAGAQLHVPHLDGKIVGGENAEIDNFPYQVSVLINGLHICGGALYKQASVVNKHIVLTAAHCVYGASTSSVSIRAGSSIRNVGGEIERVQKIHIHDKFDSATMANDIAALIINEFEDLSYIQPIETLATAGYEGRANVTGWGATSEGGSPSTQMQVANVQVFDEATCKGFYGDLIQTSMLCAGRESGGVDACQGDSGGPLVSMDATTEVKTLEGLVSWGYGCARPKYPGVYTKISDTEIQAFLTGLSAV